MARLYTLGFDDPLEFQLGTPNDDVRVRPGSIASNNAPSLSSQGVLLMYTSSCYYTLEFTDNPTDVYIAGTFAATTLTNGQFLFYVSTHATDTNYLAVVWNTNGSLSLRRTSTVLATTDPGLVTTNTAYTFQLYCKPRNSGGEVTLKIGDTTVATFSGDTTDNLEYCTRVRIYNGANSGAQWNWWDDIVINDASGTSNNSWPGPVRLTPLLARADGSVTELTRGGLDLGANFAQIRDVDPWGQHFVQGSLNQYDLYTMDVPDLPDDAIIKNVIVQMVGKSTSGTGAVAAMLKSGTETEQGSDRVFSTSPSVRQEVFAVDPNGDTAWSEAALTGLEIGVKIRS